MIDVTDVKSWAVVKVHVKLDPDTVSDMKVQYLNRRMLPDFFGAEYRFDASADRWVCGCITITGHRLLKPAADGTRRVGKDRHKSTYGWSSGDVQADGKLPEWLDKLATELRPSGRVTLPGGA